MAVLADSNVASRIPAQDLRRASVRREQGGQDADRGGLARPVRAEQAQHGADTGGMRRSASGPRGRGCRGRLRCVAAAIQAAGELVGDERGPGGGERGRRGERVGPPVPAAAGGGGAWAATERPVASASQRGRTYLQPSVRMQVGPGRLRWRSAR
jgi:hypothetical protein